MISCFVSCPAPDIGPVQAAVPTNVTVIRSGPNFRVTWTGVASADGYQVFRRTGNGAYYALAGGNTVATQYDEVSYPKDSTLQYAVKSIDGGVFSPLSEGSNVVSAWVQNVRPSRFAYSNQIALSWDLHPENPSSYNVYRYIKASGNTFNLDDTFTGITTNYFTDDDASLVSETPYFYRVTWVDALAVEYGDDAPRVLGAFSSNVIDSQEPNDDSATAIRLEHNVPVPSVLYSYGDGTGGVTSDDDWYKYTGPSGISITVSVVHPFPTPFVSLDDLHVQFQYNGETSTENDVFIDESGIMSQNDIKAINSFSFDIPTATGDVTVYFRIYSTIASTRDVIGTYTIELTY